MKTKSDSRMASSQFIPLYLDAVAANMIREDFAASIFVCSNSVYQRIYDMHQKGACKKMFPQLQTRAKRSFVDRINDAVADWEKSKGQTAAVKATEQQPKVKAKPKPKDEPLPAPPAGPDGDVDTNAFLEQLLNG